MKACINRLVASRHHQTLPPEPVARAANRTKRSDARGYAPLVPPNVTTSSPEPSRAPPFGYDSHNRQRGKDEPETPLLVELVPGCANHKAADDLAQLQSPVRR